MEKLTSYASSKPQDSNCLKVSQVMDALFPDAKDAQDRKAIENRALGQHRQAAQKQVSSRHRQSTTRKNNDTILQNNIEKLQKFFEHITKATSKSELVEKLKWRGKDADEKLKEVVRQGLAALVNCFGTFRGVDDRPGTKCATLNAVHVNLFRKYYEQVLRGFSLTFTVYTETSSTPVRWLGVYEEGGMFVLALEGMRSDGDPHVEALKLIQGRAESIVDDARKRAQANAAQKQAKMAKNLKNAQKQTLTPAQTEKLRDTALEQEEWFYEEWHKDAALPCAAERVQLQHAPALAPGQHTYQVKLGIGDVHWKEVHDVGKGNWGTVTEIHVVCTEELPGHTLTVEHLHGWLQAERCSGEAQTQLQQLLKEELRYTDVRLRVEVRQAQVSPAPPDGENLGVFYEAVRPERRLYGGAMPRAAFEGSSASLVLASPSACWVCHEVLQATQAADWCQVCGARVCPRCEALTSFDRVAHNLCVLQPAQDDEDVSMAPVDDEGVAMAPVDDEGVAMAPADDGDVSMAPAGENGAAMAPADDGDVSMAPADENGVAMAPADDEGVAMAPADDGDVAMAPAGENGAAMAPADENGAAMAPVDDEGVAMAPAEESQRTPMTTASRQALQKNAQQFLREHHAMQAVRKQAAENNSVYEYEASDEVVVSVPLYRLRFQLSETMQVESLDAISLHLQCQEETYEDSMHALDAATYRHVVAALDRSAWAREYYIEHADWHATPIASALQEASKAGHRVYLRSERFRDSAYQVLGVVARGRPAQVHASGAGRAVPPPELPVQDEQQCKELAYARSETTCQLRYDDTLYTIQANQATLAPVQDLDASERQAGCLWANITCVDEALYKTRKEEITCDDTLSPALSSDACFLQMSMEQRLGLHGGALVSATDALLLHQGHRYLPISVIAAGTIRHQDPDPSGAMLAFVDMDDPPGALPWYPATEQLLYAPGDVCVFRRTRDSEEIGVVTEVARNDNSPTLRWAAVHEDDEQDAAPDEEGAATSTDRGKLARDWEVRTLLQRPVRLLEGAGDVSYAHLHGTRLVERADPGIVAFCPPTDAALAEPLVIDDPLPEGGRWLLWQPRHMCAHCAAVATHRSCESPYLHPRNSFEMLQHHVHDTLVQEPWFASPMRDNLTRTERRLLAANNQVGEEGETDDEAEDFEEELKVMRSEYCKMCVLPTDLRVKSAYADAADRTRFFYGDLGLRNLAFAPLMREIQSSENPIMAPPHLARAWLDMCADWEEFVKWKQVYETRWLMLQEESRKLEALTHHAPKAALDAVIARVQMFDGDTPELEQHLVVQMLASKVITFWPSAKSTASPFGQNDDAGAELAMDIGVDVDMDDEDDDDGTSGNQKNRSVHFLIMALKMIKDEMKRLIPEGTETAPPQPRFDTAWKTQVDRLLHGQFATENARAFSEDMKKMVTFSQNKVKKTCEAATAARDTHMQEAKRALDEIQVLRRRPGSASWTALQQYARDDAVQPRFADFKRLKEQGLRDIDSLVALQAVTRLKLPGVTGQADVARSALLQAYLRGTEPNALQDRIMQHVAKECSLVVKNFGTAQDFDDTMRKIQDRLSMPAMAAPTSNNHAADADFDAGSDADSTDLSSIASDDDGEAADADADDGDDGQRDFLVKQKVPEQYASLMQLWREYNPELDGTGDAEGEADYGDASECLQASLFCDGMPVAPDAAAILRRDGQAPDFLPGVFEKVKAALEQQIRRGATTRVPWDFDWFEAEEDEIYYDDKRYRGEGAEVEDEENKDGDAVAGDGNDAIVVVQSAMQVKRPLEQEGATADSTRPKKRRVNEDSDSVHVRVVQLQPEQTLQAFFGRGLKAAEASAVTFEQNAIAALMQCNGHRMKVTLDLDEHLVLTARKNTDGVVEYAWQPANDVELEQIEELDRVNMRELVDVGKFTAVFAGVHDATKWGAMVESMQTDVWGTGDSRHLLKFQRLRLPASAKGWTAAPAPPAMQCGSTRTWQAQATADALFPTDEGGDGSVRVDEEALVRDIHAQTAAGVLPGGTVPAAEAPASEPAQAASEEPALDLATLQTLAAARLDWDGIQRDTEGFEPLDLQKGACVYVGWLNTDPRRTRRGTDSALDSMASPSRVSEWRVGHVQDIDDAQTAVSCLLEGEAEPMQLTRECDNTFRIAGKEQRVQLLEGTVDTNPFGVVLDRTEPSVLKNEWKAPKQKSIESLLTPHGAAQYHTGVVSQDKAMRNVRDMARFDLKQLLSRGRELALFVGTENDTAARALADGKTLDGLNRDDFMVFVPDDIADMEALQHLSNNVKETYDAFERVELLGQKTIETLDRDLSRCHAAAAYKKEKIDLDQKISSIENRIQTLENKLLEARPSLPQGGSMAGPFLQDTPQQPAQTDVDVAALEQKLEEKREMLRKAAKIQISSDLKAQLNQLRADRKAADQKYEQEMQQLEHRQDDSEPSQVIEVIKQKRELESKKITDASTRHDFAKTELGSLGDIAETWGFAGVSLKFEFNAFLQKLIERVKDQLKNKNHAREEEMVRIEWQSAFRVDGVPSFLFAQHVEVKNLADSAKYLHAPWFAPAEQRPPLHMGDCIRCSKPTTDFFTPRKVDLRQLLCVPAHHDGPITMQDAWRLDRLNAGEEVRFPLVYATRQRPVHMVPWLADETDMQLVQRLPPLVHALLTAAANVFVATHEGQNKDLLDKIDAEETGAVKGSRNEATEEDFVDFCCNVGITAWERKRASRTTGDLQNLNEATENQELPKFRRQQERIMAAFRQSFRRPADAERVMARLQAQFLVSPEKTVYATGVDNVTDEVTYHPVLGIVSALKPELLADFWQEYQLSDGYVALDDDDLNALGAAYSAVVSSGDDTDLASKQLHPQKQLREGYAREVAKARTSSGIELQSKIAAEAALKDDRVDAAVRALKQAKGPGVQSRTRKGRDVLTKPEAVAALCETLVQRLAETDETLCTTSDNEPLRFNLQVVDAMLHIGSAVGRVPPDKLKAQERMTWADNDALAGLIYFVGPGKCAALLQRGDPDTLHKHRHLLACMVSLCADVMAVLAGLEDQDATANHQMLWELWQTCLVTLCGMFMAPVRGSDLETGLFHVHDGWFLEGFDRGSDSEQALKDGVQPVQTLKWAAVDNMVVTPKIQDWARTMRQAWQGIQLADRFLYPDWERVDADYTSVVPCRLFFQDAAGRTSLARLGWTQAMHALHQVLGESDSDRCQQLAQRHAFERDVKLLQVRLEKQFPGGLSDPQTMLFDITEQARALGTHPLILLFANHVFQRQALDLRTAVTDTYFLTHEDFGKEPLSAVHIARCQELMREKIKGAEACFADGRRGGVQWVDSDEPVTFQDCTGRVCRARLQGTAVRMVRRTQKRELEATTVEFATAGQLTCLSVACAGGRELVAVGDDRGSVYVTRLGTNGGDPTTASLNMAMQAGDIDDGVKMIESVNFHSDGTELAVLWRRGEQRQMTRVSVAAAAEGGLSTVNAPPIPACAGKWFKRVDDFEQPVFTQLHDFDHTSWWWQKDKGKVWKAVRLPRSQFWSNRLGTVPKVLSAVRQKTSVREWQQGLIRVINELLFPGGENVINQSNTTVATAIHEKTGYDLCLLYSKTETQTWDLVHPKCALYFPDSQRIGGDAQEADEEQVAETGQGELDEEEERQRKRMVLAGIVERQTVQNSRYQCMFCVTTAQDDEAPEAKEDEGNEDNDEDARESDDDNNGGDAGGDDEDNVDEAGEDGQDNDDEAGEGDPDYDGEAGEGGPETDGSEDEDGNDSSSGDGDGKSADSNDNHEDHQGGDDAAPDDKELENEHEPKLEAFLNPRHLCLDRQTLADGNCQFDALARQIQVFSDDYPDLRHHDYIAVKSRVLQYLKTTPSYRDYIQDNEQGGYEKWLKKMSTPFAWGDFFTLQAAADTYRRPIHLYEYNNSLQSVTTTRIHPNEDIQPTFTIPFQVAFVPELHYYSVQKLETAQPPPSAVLAFHPVQAHNTHHRLLDGGVHGPASTTSVKKTDTKPETINDMHIDTDEDPMSLSDIFPRRIAHVLPSAGPRWYPETPPARAPGAKLKINAEASTPRRYPETPPAHAPETYYVPVAPAGLFVPVQNGQPEAAAWGGYVSFWP